MLHNIFLVPNLCNDTTTLLSTKMLSFICVFYLCKYGFDFSHKAKCRALSYTQSFLHIYKKKPNRNLLVKPICRS